MLSTEATEAVAATAAHRTATFPDEPPAPVLVSTRTERLLASGHWLLSAAPSVSQAAAEWKNSGAAWLRPRALFATMVIPARFLHAAVGPDSPEACAAPLAEALEYGPLFYSAEDFAREGSYTALVPASAARLRPLAGVVLHPQNALLLVPAPDVAVRPDADGPWWVSPLDGPGLLCSPDHVAALVGLGRDVLSRPKGRTNA